jgi:hypothetical protein
MGGELFYRKLMSIVDDYGRCEMVLSVLRARLYSQRLDDVDQDDIRGWIAECSLGDKPLVIQYVVEGKSFLEIQEFDQQLRAKQSRYPGPTDSSIRTRMYTNDNVRTLARVASAYDSDSRFVSESVMLEEPKQTAQAVEPEFEFDKWAEKRYEKHPKQTNRDYSLKALWLQFGHDPAARKLFEKNHDLFCETEEWKSRPHFVPPLSDKHGSGWVTDMAWRKPPANGAARASPKTKQEQYLEMLDQPMGLEKMHADI